MMTATTFSRQNDAGSHASTKFLAVTLLLEITLVTSDKQTLARARDSSKWELVTLKEQQLIYVTHASIWTNSQCFCLNLFSHFMHLSM